MLKVESFRGFIYLQYSLKVSPKEFLVQISIPFWRAIHDYWKILICRDIYENNPQAALYRLIYYSKSALHVSGDVFAHHHKHLTVFTVSGSVHPSCCRLAAGSNLGKHYQILYIQSSAPDDGRKHRPKHVQPTWNNKLIYIVHLVVYFHS